MLATVIPSATATAARDVPPLGIAPKKPPDISPNCITEANILDS